MHRAWCQSFGLVSENYILDEELAGCTLYLRQEVSIEYKFFSNISRHQTVFIFKPESNPEN